AGFRHGRFDPLAGLHRLLSMTLAARMASGAVVGALGACLVLPGVRCVLLDPLRSGAPLTLAGGRSGGLDGLLAAPLDEDRSARLVAAYLTLRHRGERMDRDAVRLAAESAGAGLAADPQNPFWLCGLDAARADLDPRRPRPPARDPDGLHVPDDAWQSAGASALRRWSGASAVWHQPALQLDAEASVRQACGMPSAPAGNPSSALPTILAAGSLAAGIAGLFVWAAGFKRAEAWGHLAGCLLLALVAWSPWLSLALAAAGFAAARRSDDERSPLTAAAPIWWLAPACAAAAVRPLSWFGAGDLVVWLLPAVLPAALVALRPRSIALPWVPFVAAILAALIGAAAAAG
ncbi:MAG: hypothetical protein MH204_01850, partial [Fimbriimonadaceae bacterium]|nr:hypothetical protein [Fimbriimonadaceae bacterium]